MVESQNRLYGYRSLAPNIKPNKSNLRFSFNVYTYILELFEKCAFKVAHYSKKRRCNLENMYIRKPLGTLKKLILYYNLELRLVLFNYNLRLSLMFIRTFSNSLILKRILKNRWCDLVNMYILKSLCNSVEAFNLIYANDWAY